MRDGCRIRKLAALHWHYGWVSRHHSIATDTNYRVNYIHHLIIHWSKHLNRPTLNRLTISDSHSSQNMSLIVINSDLNIWLHLLVESSDECNWLLWLRFLNPPHSFRNRSNRYYPSPHKQINQYFLHSLHRWLIRITIATRTCGYNPSLVRLNWKETQIEIWNSFQTTADEAKVASGLISDVVGNKQLLRSVQLHQCPFQVLTITLLLGILLQREGKRIVPQNSITWQTKALQ